MTQSVFPPYYTLMMVSLLVVGSLSYQTVLN